MNRRIGLVGEKYAAFFLKTNGYEIIKNNYHTRYGEIDIIARNKREDCFIEVKTRRSIFCGEPEEAFTSIKAMRFYRSIMEYYKIHTPCSWRVDLIAIRLNSFEELEDLRHYINVQLF